MLFLTLIIPFISYISLISSTTETMEYLTYGRITNEENEDISSLLLILTYPSIGLNFTNTTNSTGYFLFDFTYEFTLLLTGTLEIIDTNGRYSTYMHEVDNYLGNHYICYLGVIILQITQRNITIEGFIIDKYSKNLKNVKISLILYNETIYNDSMMTALNEYSNIYGFYSFLLQNILGSYNYKIFLNFTKFAYISTNYTYIYSSEIDESTVNINNITMQYVLRKGIIKGKVILGNTRQGLADISITYLNNKIFSEDGGYFTVIIENIKEIRKNVEIQLYIASAKGNITVRLYRKSNYSIDIGSVEIYPQSYTIFQFYGKIIDGHEGGYISNASVHLTLNNTIYQGYSRNMGDFYINTTVMIGGLYEGSLLVKKKGYLANMLNFQINANNNNSNYSYIFDSNMTSLIKKQWKYTVGVISGEIFDKTENSTLNEDILYKIQIMTTNHTNKYYAFKGKFKIFLKKLEISLNYTYNLTISCKNYKKTLYPMLILDQSNNFSSLDNVYDITRSHKAIYLHVSLYYEDPPADTPIYGSLQIYANSTYFLKKTKNITFFNNFYIDFITTVYQGYRYRGVLTLISKDFVRKRVNILFLQGISYYRYNLTVFLERKRIKGYIKGFIRNAENMKKLENVFVFVEIDIYKKSIEISGKTEKNGRFSMNISNFYKGKSYFGVICIRHVNFKSICKKIELNENNLYTLNLKALFMHRKIIKFNVTGKIIEEANNTIFSIYMRVINRNISYYSIYSDEYGIYRCDNMEIEANWGYFNFSIEVYVMENQHYEEGRKIANFSFREISGNMLYFDDIYVKAKTRLFEIKYQIINREITENIEKTLKFYQNSSKLLSTHSFLNNQTNFFYYLPITLLYNYSYSLLIKSSGYENYNIFSKIHSKTRFFERKIKLQRKNLYITICGAFIKPFSGYKIRSNTQISLKMSYYSNVTLDIYTHEFISMNSSDFYIKTKVFEQVAKVYIEVNEKGFDKNGDIFMISENISENTLKNCEITLNLSRIMKICSFFGVFTDFDSNSLLYIRSYAVDMIGIYDIDPLVVFVDGRWNWERNAYIDIGYIAQIIEKGQNNTWNIICQFAFISENHENIEIKKHINIPSFNISTPYTPLSGYVYDHSNTSLPLKNVYIYGKYMSNSSFLMGFTSKTGFFNIFCQIQQISLIIFTSANYHEYYLYINHENYTNMFNFSMNRIYVNYSILIYIDNDENSTYVVNYTLKIYEKYNKNNVVLCKNVEISSNSAFFYENDTKSSLLEGKQYQAKLILYKAYKIPLNLTFSLKKSNLYTKILNITNRFKPKYMKFHINCSFIDALTLSPAKIKCFFLKFIENYTKIVQISYKTYIISVNERYISDKILLFVPETSIYMNTSMFISTSMLIYIDLGEIYIERKMIYIEFTGFVYEICEKSNKTVNTFNISVEMNFSSKQGNITNFTKISKNFENISISYSIYLYIPIDIPYKVKIFLEKTGFDTYITTLKSRRFYRNNECIYADGYLKRSYVDINVKGMVYFEKNEDISVKNIVFFEILVFSMKTQKLEYTIYPATYMQNISFYMQVSVENDKLSKISLSFRFSSVFQTEYFDVEIKEFSANVTKTLIFLQKYDIYHINIAEINGTVKDIENRTLKFIEIVVDCGFTRVFIRETDRNGRYFLRFIRDTQNYLCIMKVDGYSNEIPIYMNNETGYMRDVGCIYVEKYRYLARFYGKLKIFLKNVDLLENFTVFLNAKEMAENGEFIEKNRKYIEISRNFIFFESILLKIECIYEITVIFWKNDRENLNFHFFTSEKSNLYMYMGVFLLKSENLQKNVVLYGNIYYTYNISQIYIVSRNNDFLAIFAKNSTFDDNGAYMLSWKMDIKEEFRTYLFVIEENNEIYSRNIDFNDSNSSDIVNIDVYMKPYYYKNRVKSCFLDNSTNLPIKNDFLVNFSSNTSYILPTYMLIKGNIFGLFVSSLFLPQTPLNYIINITIYSYEYQIYTYLYNFRENILYLGIFSQKTVNYTIYGNIYDFLNISQPISFVSAIIQIFHRYMINITTNYTGILEFSNEFSSLDVLNMSVFLEKSHFKSYFEDISLKLSNFNIYRYNFNKTSIIDFYTYFSYLQYLYKAFNTSIYIDIGPFYMISNTIKGNISGLISPYNHTYMKLVIFSRKTHKNLTKPINTLYFNVTNEAFMLNYTLDPTKSPYIAHLSIYNSDYKDYITDLILSYTNEFSAKFPEILHLSEIPSISLFIYGIVSDAQLSNTYINDFNIFINVSQYHMKNIVSTAIYIANRSDGSFNESISIVIDEKYRLNYTVFLCIKKENFEKYIKKYDFSLNNSNSVTILWNLANIFISHKKTTSMISGILYDKVLWIPIYDATVTSTATCIDTNELELTQVFSDYKGYFAINSDVFEGFSYQIIFLIEIDDFEGFSITLTLNESNNYTIALGVINMTRIVIAGVIEGNLIDDYTDKPLIGWGIFFETLRILIYTGENGNFSAEFDAFQGLDYEENITFPLNTFNNSMFFEEKSKEISLNSWNKYSISLNSLYCDRKNVTYHIYMTFYRNFTLSSSLNFSLLLNLTAGDKCILSLTNFEFLANIFNLSVNLTNLIGSGLNYTVSFILISDAIDDCFMTFVLNTENSYNVDLGVINLSKISEKASLIGEILDSTDFSPVVNASLELILSDIYENLTYFGYTDENGNFSIIVKISVNSTNFTENITYLCKMRIYKLFYENVDLSFNLSLDTHASNNNYLINFGVIYMTPDYVEGGIYGSVIDIVINKVFGGIGVKLSISENNNTISFNQLVTDRNGSFTLIQTLEKGIAYSVSIEISGIDYFDDYQKSVQLSEENNYTVNFYIFLIRKKVFGVFSGFLYDNYTRNPVDYVSYELLITFEREIINSSTNITLDINASIINIFNMSSHGYIGIYKENDNYEEISLFYQNFSDFQGHFKQTVDLWAGISYNSNIAFYQKTYILYNISQFINFTNNYQIYYGQVYLFRNTVYGMIWGYIYDEIYGFSLKNVSIMGQVYEKNNEFGGILMNFSDLYGNYSIFIDGLYDGLNYTINLTGETMYFQVISHIITLNYNEIDGYNKEIILSMTRLSCNISISGKYLSKLTNDSISNAMITTTASIFLVNTSINTVKTNKIGYFIINMKTLYEGLNYTVYFQNIPGIPYINTTNVISIYTENTSIALDLGVIYIETTEISINFKGILREFDDNTVIISANITFYIIDIRWNCSINANLCRNQVISTNSDENGDFYITSKGYLQENYMYFISEEAEFFNKSAILTGYLNISNNYTYDIGVIYMYRLTNFAYISGYIYDNLTNKLLDDININYTILSVFDENTIIGKFEDITGNITENLIVYTGRNYTMFLMIYIEYYTISQVNFSFGGYNNYTYDIGSVYMYRTLKEIEIYGDIIDNLTVLGVPYASINLMISPYIGKYVTNANKSGYFSQMIEVYQGLSYLVKISIYEKYYKIFKNSDIIAKNVNSSYYQVNLYRKNVSFLIIGLIKNDADDIALNDVSVKANFSLNPILHINDISFDVKTNSTGFFNITGEIPDFLAINCTIIFKKKGYNTMKLDKTLTETMNYTLIISKTIVMTTENSGESGEISIKVSNHTEKISFQVISHSFCKNNKLIYVKNASIWLESQDNILVMTYSNDEGMVTLEAPLVFMGDSPASYETTVEIEKEGFYSREIDVQIGGDDWQYELNLGEIELIQEKC